MCKSIDYHILLSTYMATSFTNINTFITNQTLTKVLDYANTLVTTQFGINLNLVKYQDNIYSLFILCPITLIVLVIGLAIGLAFYFLKSNKKSQKFEAKLVDIKEVTHDSKIFKFLLPQKMKKIGLKVGEHLEIEAQINGQTVKRKYTPISRPDITNSTFDLLVKIYRKNGTNPGGVMSQYLESLKQNDKINVQLPFGRFNYLGQSKIQIKQLSTPKCEIATYKNLYLVGGGTGITPLYQIIQYITETETPAVSPKITLLFANRSEDDILLLNELKQFQKLNPNLKIYFSVDKPITTDWTGFTGFIDTDKIKKTVTSDISNTFFAVCGPAILCSNVQKILLNELKVPMKQIFRF